MSGLRLVCSIVNRRLNAFGSSMPPFESVCQTKVGSFEKHYLSICQDLPPSLFTLEGELIEMATVKDSLTTRTESERQLLCAR